MTSWLANYGVFAVFVLMAIDAVFPAASEAVMVYGGALASGALAHELHIFGWHATGLPAYIAVVLAGVVGYQLGAIAGWWVGIRLGREFLERHGRWLHLSASKLDRSERWFDRWEGWAVFLGRITPVARSFISIPAGVFEVEPRRYNVLTLLGNAIWCVALAGVGWAIGANYKKFDHDFRYVEYAVVAGILAFAAYWFVRRRRTATITAGHDDPSR
ncbi:MAG TPA: DedA family protein [Gaiellaceae bacterium]|nr:DedA family protein [Gaiellaceae bacterium]